MTEKRQAPRLPWVHATVLGSYDNNNFWWPADKIGYAPIFHWPPPVLNFLKWLLGVPGYLFGWNTVYVLIAYSSWAYFQPTVAQCKELSWDWVLPMLVRNMTLLWMFAGTQHLIFYTLRAVGSTQKYNPAWQDSSNERFLLGSQTYECVALSCLSGVPIWTAYEVFFYWAWANGKLPYGPSWMTNPYWNAALLVLIPFWRELHFYFIHRFIHYQPLYRWVHRVHHKNFNPGPWAGMAMHPVEHLFYFSVLLIHAVVPSHPLHMIFNAQHTALTPALGHSGFHGPYLNGWIPGGSYFHYLHHAYFECNYGESTLPLDWLFGTFRDGEAEYRTAKAQQDDREQNDVAKKGPTAERAGSRGKKTA